MTRIKGKEIVETADYEEADIKNLRSLKRQVDVGYRRFMERRGLSEPNNFKASVNAGLKEAVAAKRKGNKPRNDGLDRPHWWCGSCRWFGKTEDSVSSKAGKLCCPKCGNTDVRENGSPFFMVV